MAKLLIAMIVLAAGVARADDAKDLKVRCLKEATAKRWVELHDCAQHLATLDLAAAKQLATKAKAELGNENALEKMFEELVAGDMRRARILLEMIDDDSVYRKEAETKLEEQERKMIAGYVARAKAFAKEKKCTEIQTLEDQGRAQSKVVGDAVHDVKCEAAPEPTVPVVALCDPAALTEKAREAFIRRAYAQALVTFEASLTCKDDPAVYPLAFTAACDLGNAIKAKAYFFKLRPEKRSMLLQICLRNSIDPR
jgi:hypothetical protein